MRKLLDSFEISFCENSSFLAAQDLQVHQMIMKSAFLERNMEHEIFMNQPEGFEDAGREEILRIGV